jgi:8-hydroxy-5-deazaflavin:NADPH oxidoreductase
VTSASTGSPSTSAPNTVGLLGGTGPAGRGLALRLAAAGHDVIIGSREEVRGREVANEIDRDLPGSGGSVRGGDNREAAAAELVVMAAPWAAALGLSETFAEQLEGKTVVSMVNALTRSGRTFMPLTLPRGSVAAELQARMPGAQVVGAFHHLPADALADLGHTLACDILVYGDDDRARQRTMTLVERIAGLRAIDVGTLTAAGAVEAMTAVLIQVNVRYRTHSMVRLIGDLD